MSFGQSSSNEPTGAQALLVEPADRAQHPQRELPGAHLHREHRDRHALVDGDVLADVQRQGRLPHCGSAGDDDQVTGLKAGCLGVEVGEPGRHPGDIRRIRALEQFLDALDDLGQQRLDLLESLSAASALLGDLEDLGLGLVEDLLRLAPGGVQGARGDLVAGRDQAAQHRALAHDLRVATDVGGRRRVLGERVQVDEAAGVVSLAGIAQRLVDRDRVRGLAAIDQPADGPEDQLVVLPVEVGNADQVGNAVPGSVVDQQPAQDGLLGLDGVRRGADGRELRIDRLVHGMGRREGCRTAGTATIQATAPRISRLRAPCKRQRRPEGRRCAGSAGQPRQACSPTTVTLTSATTSVCSATLIGCSPTVFSGPCGMRTCALLTWNPCLVSASEMS